MAWYDSILDFGKTYGKDIVSAGTDVYDIYKATQRQDTAQDAAQPGGIADPFGVQRPQFQQKLSQLYNDPSSLQNLPGFAFAQQIGEQGVNRAAAKSGHFQSPNRMQNLMKFNQGLAGQFYNQEADRLQQLAGANFQPQAGALPGLLQQDQLATQNIGAGGTDIWKTISKYFSDDSAPEQQGGAGQTLQDVAFSAGGDFLKDKAGEFFQNNVGIGGSTPTVSQTAAMEDIGAQASGTGSLATAGAGVGAALGGAIGSKYFGDLIGKDSAGADMFGGVLGSVGGSMLGSMAMGGTAAAGAAVGGAAVPAAVVAIVAGNIMASRANKKFGRKVFGALADDQDFKMGTSPAGIAGAKFKDPVTGKDAWMSQESFDVLQRVRSGEQKRGGKKGFMLSDAGDGRAGMWNTQIGIMDQTQLTDLSGRTALGKSQSAGEGGFRPIDQTALNAVQGESSLQGLAASMTQQNQQIFGTGPQSRFDRENQTSTAQLSFGSDKG